jgi:hypothetical protein
MIGVGGDRALRTNRSGGVGSQVRQKKSRARGEKSARSAKRRRGRSKSLGAVLDAGVFKEWKGSRRRN